MSKEEKKEPGYALGTEVDGSDSFDTINALIAEGTVRPCGTAASKLTPHPDHQHDIKLRTMSWQKTACLLAGDQVCLAIMAQSWSLS